MAGPSTSRGGSPVPHVASTTLDSSYETARCEAVPGIELVLDPPHHREARHRTPHVEDLPHPRRGGQDDRVPTQPYAVGAQRLDPGDVVHRRVEHTGAGRATDRGAVTQQL